MGVPSEYVRSAAATELHRCGLREACPRDNDRVAAADKAAGRAQPRHGEAGAFVNWNWTPEAPLAETHTV
jgi:hypothetical protein